MKPKSVSVILVAAGNGSRFGRDKLFTKVGQQTVIERTLRKFLPFLENRSIAEIILVINPKKEADFQSLLKQHQLTDRIRLLHGGHERWESSYLGVKAAQSPAVLIHDAARPFISPVIIQNTIDQLQTKPAILVAIPSVNSVKLVIDGQNTQSLPRANIWLAQTPQAFDRDLLLAAYKTALAQDFTQMTDESELITRFLAQPVSVIKGDESNLKITFVNDLPLAEEIASQEDQHDSKN